MTGSSPAGSPARARKPEAYYGGRRTHFLEWLGGRHERVLEVGCGSGGNATWLREHGARRIVGVEPDQPSALQARSTFDRVYDRPIEAALDDLDEEFDLILCLDVLEHLVDPWSVVARLRSLCRPRGVLAASVPNVRHFLSLYRIAFGAGFRYESSGVFDSTHLRFFTRSTIRSLLVGAGWRPQRWGSAPSARLTTPARVLATLSGGRSDEWLVEQWYVTSIASPRA